MSDNTKITETELPEGTADTASKGGRKNAGKKSDDPWARMHEVLLPRAGKKEQNFREVYINGRCYQVPRGKRVEVPEPVFEVLKLAGEAEEYAEERRSEMLETAKEPVYR